MEHSHRYQFKEKWIFCINITQEYFDDLIRMSEGDLEKFLEYLYEKFKKRIMYLRASERKRTATADYQPRRKNYKRKIISIVPTIWQRYWDLRLNTGYSMSCIIRIFIEWEKLDRGEVVDDLYLYPIEIEDPRLEYQYPSNYQVLNNYRIKRKLKRHNRKLFFRYWDDS